MLSFIGWVKRCCQRYPQMEYPVKSLNGVFLKFIREGASISADSSTLAESLVPNCASPFLLVGKRYILSASSRGELDMRCKKCGSGGPFYASVREGSEVHGQCKACSSGASKALGKQIKKLRRAKTEQVVDLPCHVCKRDLPSTAFAPSVAAGLILGFAGTCRECRRPLDRAKYQKRKEAAATREDYSDLV